MEKQQTIFYRGDEFVIVEKIEKEFHSELLGNTWLFVDTDGDGEYEYKTKVAKDGIASMTFSFSPKQTTKNGKVGGLISSFVGSADGRPLSPIKQFMAIRESLDNPAKAIPVNCAVDDDGELIEPNICTCVPCYLNDTLLGANLEGFSHSFTPVESGVETASGKYRAAFPITKFDTQKLNFEFNLHHASLVKYGGPMGQNFSHSFNMMLVQTGELSGQVVTPDLRIYDITSEDGINWHLPDGFYARLCLEPETNRWLMSHYSGLEVSFYHAQLNCPGYPVSISDPNGNTSCMTYDAAGYLQTFTTDLGQVQQFDYDRYGRLSNYQDHLGRSWQFPHDAEGRLSGIATPSTEFANVTAGQEISQEFLDKVLVDQQRCWLFSYLDDCFPNHISAETDPRGETYRKNLFDEMGRVVTASINSKDITIDYCVYSLPFDMEILDCGNILRKITDRETNVRFHEIHGRQGGPNQNLGQFGLRREIILTETGKGNPPLREDEPNYWEQRWVFECDCLVPLVMSEPFASKDIHDFIFDDFAIPQNYPRHLYTYNEFHQKTAWEYTDGNDSIKQVWAYQQYAFGDNHQFSRMLTEIDTREFDTNAIYAGVNFVHQYRYDDFGNKIQHDAPRVSLGTDIPQKISEYWTYNDFGQRLSHTDANGNITSWRYFSGKSSGGDINSKGRFGGYLKSTTQGDKGSADEVTRLTWNYRVNALGMVTRMTDPNGFQYDNQYNDLQETTVMLKPYVTLINGNQVRYQTQQIFDGAGNVLLQRRSNINVQGIAEKNSMVDTAMTYDSVNNILSERREVDDIADNDLITRFAYDGNDDQIAIQKPKGNRNFSLFDERRLEFKRFYGVAAPQSLPDNSTDLLEDYPTDKRTDNLGSTQFVGLAVSDYDARMNMVSTKDGRGNLSLHYYDFYNRKFAYSDPNGNGWVRQFDDADNVLTESHGAVSTSCAVSNSNAQITHELSRTYNRFDEVGRRYQRVEVIDLEQDFHQVLNPADGKNSSFITKYDPGSRVSANVDANGNMTQMAYDAANRMTQTTDAQGNQQKRQYDKNSNVVEITDIDVPGPSAIANTEIYVTSFVYDQVNRMTEQHILGLNGNSLDHDWLYAYDSRDNQRLTRDAEGNISLITFDDQDRRTMMQRFNANPLITQAEELLHYEWQYDTNDNLVKVRALANVEAPNSAQITQFSYDDLDRNIRTIYPDSKDLLDMSLQGREEQFDGIEVAYDENSNPLRVSDQRGVIIMTQFDPGNRPTKQNITLPQNVPGTDQQRFEFDALNRMTVASNNFAKVDKTFDSLSRIVTETQSIRLNGQGFEQGWQNPIEVVSGYDQQSNHTSYLVNDCDNQDLAVTCDFDLLNRHKNISARYFDVPMHRIASYCFLGPDRLVQKRLGNGALLDCLYDAKRRISDHIWQNPDKLLIGFEYQYDRMDNSLYERFLHDKGLCDQFRYNDRFDITGVDYRVAGKLMSDSPTNKFSYDNIFNRQQAVFGDVFGLSAKTQDQYQANQANEYTVITRNGQDNSQYFDRAGNTSRFLSQRNDGQVGLANIQWDAFNLLFAVEQDEQDQQGVRQYRYDPFKRRVAEFSQENGQIGSSSRRYIYHGWTVLEERLFNDEATLDDAVSTLERVYVHGRLIDEPLLTAIDTDKDGELGADGCKNQPNKQSDKEYYLLNNRLGSVMALLDADDSTRLLEAYRYTVFGQPSVITLPEKTDNCAIFNAVDTKQQVPSVRSVIYANPFLFSARRFEDCTGLYYYRNRYYDMYSGRFISRDPLKYEDGINLYAFVGNHPTDWIDPMGTKAYSPSSPAPWKKSGYAKFKSGDQISLAFLGDFITYNRWEYPAEREAYGPCNTEVKGFFEESSSWSLSLSQTTTGGGSVGGGVGGHQGGASGSAEVSGSISTSLGVSIGGGTKIRNNYSCKAKPGKKATAVLEVSVDEVSGTYIDWHFFSGTRYEFHLHKLTWKGWNCKYTCCP